MIPIEGEFCQLMVGELVVGDLVVEDLWMRGMGGEGKGERRERALKMRPGAKKKTGWTT